MATFPDMPQLSTVLYLYKGELGIVQSFINTNTSMITYGELYGLKAHSGSPVIQFASLEKMSQSAKVFPLGKHPAKVINDYHLDFVGQWFSFENIRLSFKEFLNMKLAELEHQTMFLIMVERQATTDYQTFLSKLRTFCLVKSSEGCKAAVYKVNFKIIERESPFRIYLCPRENFKCSPSEAGAVRSTEKYNSVGETSTLEDVSETGRTDVELTTLKMYVEWDAGYQEANGVNDVYFPNTCNQMIEVNKVGMSTKLKEKVNHNGCLSEKVSEFGVHENGQPDWTEPQKVLTDVKKDTEKIEEEKAIETRPEPGLRENGQPDWTEPQKVLTDVKKDAEKIEEEKAIETSPEPGVCENGQPDWTEPQKVLTDVKKDAEKIEEEKAIETSPEPGVCENGQPDWTEPQKVLTDVKKDAEKIEEEKAIETSPEPGMRENGQPDWTEPQKVLTDVKKDAEKIEEEKAIETSLWPGMRENGQPDWTEPQKVLTDVKKDAEKIKEEKAIETSPEPGVCENGQPDWTEPQKETDIKETAKKIEEEKVIETNSEPDVNKNGQLDSTKPQKETDVDETENDLQIKPNDTQSENGETADRSDRSAISSSSQSEVISESPAESTSAGKEDPSRSSQSEVQENVASDNDSTDDEYDKEENKMSRKNKMKNMICKKIKKTLPCGVKCVGRYSLEIDIDDVWKFKCQKGQDNFRQTTVTVESKSHNGFKRSKKCGDQVDEITEFVVESILEMTKNHKKMKNSQ